jgi:vanillate O-demethylase ferredoxin subunit
MILNVRAGDQLYILPPSNDFPLSPQDDNIVLLAGGIGVTPIASMAVALSQQGKRFVMHYTSRSRSLMAFQSELSSLLGDRLHLHFDDEPANALSLADILDQYRPSQPIYCCGPRGMIDAAFSLARARGWPESALRSELFEEARPSAADKPFEVELAVSRKVLVVPPEKTLLEVLLEAGIFVPNDCRAGACGLCGVNVLAGEVDHRDDYLLDEDKAENRIIQTCVSRAKGARLVLDL